MIIAHVTKVKFNPNPHDHTEEDIEKGHHLAEYLTGYMGTSKVIIVKYAHEAPDVLSKYINEYINNSKNSDNSRMKAHLSFEWAFGYDTFGAVSIPLSRIGGWYNMSIGSSFTRIVTSRWGQGIVAEDHPDHYLVNLSMIEAIVTSNFEGVDEYKKIYKTSDVLIREFSDGEFFKRAHSVKEYHKKTSEIAIQMDVSHDCASNISVGRDKTWWNGDIENKLIEADKNGNLDDTWKEIRSIYEHS